MQRQLRLLRLLILAGFTAMFVACHEERTVRHVGVSQCSSDDWRTKMNNEMLREAAYIGNMELHIRSAADNSDRQSADIDSFINEGVDLLIVSPNEALGVTAAIRRARAAGIPVILVDRRITTNDYDVFIGADNYAIGYKAGRYAASALDGQGRIVELTGLRGSSSAEDRHRGFADALKESPGINFSESIDASWNDADARQTAETLIASTDLPQPDLIFAHNDRMAAGARSAYADTPGVRIPHFIGVDALNGKEHGIDYVLDRKLLASLIYPSGGDRAIQVADSLMRGLKVQRDISLPVALVDSANVHIVELQMIQIAKEEAKINSLNQRLGSFWDRFSQQGTMLSTCIIIIVLIGVIIVLVLRSYWSKVKTNRELNIRKTELEEQKATLETQKERLEAQKARLEGQTGTLEAQKHTLEVQTLKLETQRATLEHQKMLLESHKKTLVNQKHMLEQQKMDLEKQADRLHEQTAQLRLQAETLEQQKDKLLNQRTQLALLTERLEKAEDQCFISNVRDVINRNLADPEFGVVELAEGVCLSRAQLFRKVKEACNCSPVELIRAARLKRAAELLGTTDKSVSEVCFATGFSSPSYFTKCYKAYFDTPPRNFKKTAASRQAAVTGEPAEDPPTA